MRLNLEKIEQSRNLLGEIQLTDCKWFRKEAENTLTLLMRIHPFAYESVEEFNAVVVAEYWREYDALDAALEKHANSREFVWFRDWYVNQATNPDKIQRAIRWLTEKGTNHEYITLTPTIKERAGKYAESIRSAIGIKGGK